MQSEVLVNIRSNRSEICPQISGEANNLFCLLLLTQNKTWLEGREKGAILQEWVNSSRAILFDGEKQFSREPLEIKKKITRQAALENLIVLDNLYQVTVPVPVKFFGGGCLFVFEVGAYFFIPSLFQWDSSIISTFEPGSHFQAYTRDA